MLIVVSSKYQIIIHIINIFVMLYLLIINGTIFFKAIVNNYYNTNIRLKKNSITKAGLVTILWTETSTSWQSMFSRPLTVGAKTVYCVDFLIMSVFSSTGWQIARHGCVYK